MKSGDFFVIGTAENLEAEYAVEPYNPERNKFMAAQFYNGEPVATEGFETKEEALASLKTTYAGCDVERLF